jgi:hypothetical protein
MIDGLAIGVTVLNAVETLELFAPLPSPSIIPIGIRALPPAKRVPVAPPCSAQSAGQQLPSVRTGPAPVSFARLERLCQCRCKCSSRRGEAASVTRKGDREYPSYSCHERHVLTAAS